MITTSEVPWFLRYPIIWISTNRRVAHRKLACIQATEGLVHKCHSIRVLSTSQYELNTKHFLTLLSTVLVKACSVCGLLFVLVIEGEPPAWLCLDWLRLWQGTGPLLTPWLQVLQIKPAAVTVCCLLDIFVNFLTVTHMPSYISIVLCCLSDWWATEEALLALDGICPPLQWTNRLRILTQDWQRAKAQTLHLFSISRSSRHWPFFTFLRKCVGLFVHSSLN